MWPKIYLNLVIYWAPFLHARVIYIFIPPSNKTHTREYFLCSTYLLSSVILDSLCWRNMHALCLWNVPTPEPVRGGSGQVLSLHILKFLPSELIYRFNLCLCFTGMISALRANFCFLVHLITCHEEKNKKKNKQSHLIWTRDCDAVKYPQKPLTRNGLQESRCETDNLNSLSY